MSLAQRLCAAPFRPAAVLSTPAGARDGVFSTGVGTARWTSWRAPFGGPTDGSSRRRGVASPVGAPGDPVRQTGLRPDCRIRNVQYRQTPRCRRRRALRANRARLSPAGYRPWVVVIPWPLYRPAVTPKGHRRRHVRWDLRGTSGRAFCGPGRYRCPGGRSRVAASGDGRPVRTPYRSRTPPAR